MSIKASAVVKDEFVDVVTAPPAVQTVEIDGRDSTIPNASDFLSQTAHASEPTEGM